MTTSTNISFESFRNNNSLLNLGIEFIDLDLWSPQKRYKVCRDISTIEITPTETKIPSINVFKF